MRILFATFALVCAGLLVTTDSNLAGDKKETVLKGTITCNKCDLGNTTKCETVIVVKDKETKKDVIYIFDKAAHGKYHEGICKAAKAGTVTGTVKDVDTKKVITVKKVEFDK
jgi:hypothetical protein